HRRHREVTLLVPRPVPHVRAPIRPRVPDPLFRVDVVVALVRVLVEAHRIEDVKLRLGPVVRGGGDSRLDEVLLRFLRHVARIARVALARHRVGHVTRERKGRDFETRIDEGTRRVREQQHVALVDRLEPANRGAVEPDPLGKQLFAQLFQRDGKVLPRARQVGEPQIHHLHAGFLRLPHHIRGRSTGRGLYPGSSCGWLQRRGHRIGLLERSLSGECTDDARNESGPRHVGSYRGRCGVSTVSCRRRNRRPTEHYLAGYPCTCAYENVQDVQGSLNIDSTVQRRHEVPKLHSRKFPEALLNLTLRPLEEDPAGGAAMLPVHDMHAPPHRAYLAVRLHLGEPVPSSLTALQLTHVLGAVLAREGGAHGVKSWLTRLHYAASPIPAS